MDMWISFEVAPKGMNNSNKTIMKNIRISEIFFRIPTNFMNSLILRFNIIYSYGFDPDYHSTISQSQREK